MKLIDNFKCTCTYKHCYYQTLRLNFFLELGNDLISSLDSGVAKRALVQCTDIITESNIDASALARRLYSKEVISEGLYKRVRDKKTGDSNEDRLELVLDDLKSRVTHNASIFISFLNILNDLTQQDLSVLIVRKYKGMLYGMLCYNM